MYSVSCIAHPTTIHPCNMHPFTLILQLDLKYLFLINYFVVVAAGKLLNGMTFGWLAGSGCDCECMVRCDAELTTTTNQIKLVIISFRIKNSWKNPILC